MEVNDGYDKSDLWRTDSFSPTPTVTPSTHPTLTPGPSPTPPQATLPFCDGFESGSLGTGWTIHTTFYGRVRVRNRYPQTGSYSLTLDTWSWEPINSIAAAVLTVDLSQQTESSVNLGFWWREFVSPGEHPEDGVFISDDYGDNWYQVLSFNNGSQSYTQEILSLSDLKDTYGLVFNDHFQVKFQYYGNLPIEVDGYAVDEVELWVPSPTMTPTPYGFKTPSPTPSTSPVPSASPTPSVIPSPTTTPTPLGFKTPTPSPSCEPVVYVPDDYSTIQSALDAACDEQTIIVRDGIYTGEGNRDIDFLGKNVFLRSENGAENTIIDCTGSGRRGFYFHSGETAAAVLDGFTITGGRLNRENGGGIYVESASPTITNCIISDCSISASMVGYYYQDLFGGGIYLSESSSAILNCVIENNEVVGLKVSDLDLSPKAGEANGGGVYCYGGSVLISNCLIQNNYVEGGRGSSSVMFGPVYGGDGNGAGICGPAIVSHCEIYNNRAIGGWGVDGGSGRGGGVKDVAEVDNCLIHYNSAQAGSGKFDPGYGYGGGVYGSPDITNCTLYGNEADSAGGGINGSPTVVNSIIWANSLNQLSGSPTVSYSNIEYGWTGASNIDSDPQFVSLTDFHLKPGSPCIDTGDNGSVEQEFDLAGNLRIAAGVIGAVTVDMGPYESGDYALREGFDNFEFGERPTDWIFTGCSGNTNAYLLSGEFGFGSPSIKLDSSGDIVTTSWFILTRPGTLSLWLRELNRNSSSALMIEEYYSSTWNPATTITTISYEGALAGPVALNNDAVRLRFTFAPDIGHIALDDVLVLLSPATPTPSVTPTPYGYESPTPSLTPTPVGFKTPTPTPTPEGYKTPLPTATLTPPPTPGPTLTPGMAPTPELEEARVGIFRPSSGLWAIKGTTRAYFGGSADIPLWRDYDGDGSGDIAIFRPASGLWAVKGVTRAYFGGSSDQPVPADYNGDGSSEIAIFRESSGLWAVKGVTRAYFGGTGDVPVPGDYSGNYSSDLAIFRTSSGLWAIKGFTRAYFGSSSDTPVPGDYSGDGTEDIAIFRGTSGLWAIRGWARSYFGGSSDQPVPGDYSGDGTDDIGIFRENSGLWAIRSVTRSYFGTVGDVPVTR